MAGRRAISQGRPRALLGFELHAVDAGVRGLSPGVGNLPGFSASGTGGRPHQKLVHRCSAPKKLPLAYKIT
jgi:hypothetical protein